jgi:3-dehydroquinate synthase
VRVVEAKRPTRYEVVEADLGEKSALERLLEADWAARGAQRKCFVVLDASLRELYPELDGLLGVSATRAQVLTLEIASEAKEFELVAEVIRGLVKHSIHRRRDVVLAVGGGTLMDIVGLACALYRRGIPYSRLPTTLVGMIDAGVGVKTGVDFSDHKNLLGAYHAPKAVLLYEPFLRTLPKRQLSNGLAEMIKIALVRDRALYELLMAHADDWLESSFTRYGPEATTAIRRAAIAMMDELEPNLWEALLERSVDFGHTFSPALEVATRGEVEHGEAVAIDMTLSIVLSRNRGYISPALADEMTALIASADLPLYHERLDAPLARQALADAVIHRDGLQRIPLLKGVTRVGFVNDVAPDELAESIDELRGVIA